MRHLFTLSLLTFGLVAWAAKNPSNVDKNGVILSGYDAVSYFQGPQPLKGKSEFQTTYEDAVYWFASSANKAEFLQNPKKYAPQFGGWCAFAVADSKSKVEVDPKSFLIQDGRLLLFYNGIWADTRKKWQTTAGKNATEFLREADANWPTVKTKDP